jgi:alkylhydroperoxidase family enzyme
MDIRHAVGVKAGVPAAKLAALADWETSPEFTGPERAALAFAAALVREDHDVSDACYARVREHFSEGEVLELTFVIGYQTVASQFARAFRLGPQGFSV